MEARLSNDKSGVYSEFTVQVSEALKSKSSVSVTAGDTLVVERPGGIVKYSDNHTRLYRVEGKGMPRLGGRYVLFLSMPNSKVEPDQSYVIITGYEIYMKRVQIKAEYNQLLEMAAAFGVRLLGTALVVISGFYRFPRQRTQVGFLSDHCRRIEVDYQSGSKQPHSKGSADLCTRFK